MGTKNFSNANDLITFSRSSAGTALRKIAYGPELVTNGTFDTDTDWTKGTGWTISGGRASFSNPTGTSISQVGLPEMEVGKVYLLSFDMDYTSGAGCTVGINVGGGIDTFGTFNSTATHVSAIVPTLNRTGISITGIGNSILSIDNISVKEVLFDDASGDLTLFNHPADVPRIEYDADGNVLGLLVEESRTNLITYSEDFTDASWTPSGATFTGTDEAILTAGDFINTSVTPATATQHVVSIDVKKTSTGFIRFGAFRTGGLINNVSGWFDTSTGQWDAFSANGTYTNGLSFVRDIGDYWRISLSAVFPTDAQSIYVYNTDTSGSTTRSTTQTSIITRAQLEAGSFPTSYIKTTGATATRSADVASIPVADFGFNQSEGSVVCEFYSKHKDEERRLFTLGVDGSSSGRVLDVYRSTGSGISMYNGTSAFSRAESVTEPDTTAAAYKSGDYAVALDGAVTTNTSTTVNTPDILYLGRYVTDIRHLNGHIKSIKYYPRRLTNAQLQELTT